MKRVFMLLIAGCTIWLCLSACGDKQEPEGKQAVKGTQEARQEGPVKKTPQRAATGKGRGLGMVRDPTRLHPGWECSNHPGVRSAYPVNCPIDSMPMVREGKWTCLNHPQVSSTGPGNCPFDGADLVKVEDLEKEKGKTIAELTKEYLAAQK